MTGSGHPQGCEIPAFFFDDYDDGQTGLLQEQVELLALIRDARINAAQLRTILRLSPEARKAITDLIEVTVRDEARRRRSGEGESG